MPDNTQNTTETTTRNGDTIQKTTATRSSMDDGEHRTNTNLGSRIVWFIAGVLLVLLGLRFILTLLGANTTNGFANFIYTTSHPFVDPFFSLFNYHSHTYGTSHFEIYTLVAMLVYALIAWGITKLLTINRE